MRPAAWVAGALAMAVLGASGLPVTGSGPAVLAAGTGAPPLEALADLLGGSPATATLTTWAADGPVARTVAWAELEEALGATSFGGPRQQPSADHGARACLPGVYCGPDAGFGSASGPFCDSGSAWVLYSGAPAGSAYAEATPGMGPTPTICGGFFGPTRYWLALELSPAKDPDVAVGLEGEGCYAAHWYLGSDGMCHESATARDTFLLQWRARGPAVKASLSFGPSLVLDYALGGEVVACYDLLPGMTFNFAGTPPPGGNPLVCP